VVEAELRRQGLEARTRLVVQQGLAAVVLVVPQLLPAQEAHQRLAVITQPVGLPQWAEQVHPQVAALKQVGRRLPEAASGRLVPAGRLAAAGPAQWVEPAQRVGVPQPAGKGARMEVPGEPRVLRVVTVPEEAKRAPVEPQTEVLQRVALLRVVAHRFNRAWSLPRKTVTG